MKRIVHLSDLHFGRNNEKVVRAIAKTVKKIDPDILIVSGDLTQRAKISEFKQAKEFLNSFNCKKLVIPGNHDIPLYNLFARTFKPFHKYKQFIAKNLEPIYYDSEVAVIGANTARRGKISSGAINLDQVGLIKKFFEDHPKAAKILVAHHPFDLPDKFSSRKLVGGAKKVMQHLIDGGTDLILGGHMHISHARSVADRYKVDGKAAFVVQASTISERSRGEPPTFNVIEIKNKKVSLSRYIYSEQTFVRSLTEELNI